MSKKEEKINLKLSVEEAREMYPNAPESVKLMMEKNFGKPALVFDVRERINSLEDAYEDTKRPRSFRDADEDMEAFMQATYDAAVFTEAMNKGKHRDIYDGKARHYPLWNCKGSPSGFAFYRSRRDYDFAGAGSGSRLSFFEREHSDHAAKTIPEVYRTMLDS